MGQDRAGAGVEHRRELELSMAVRGAPQSEHLAVDRFDGPVGDSSADLVARKAEGRIPVTAA